MRHPQRHWRARSTPDKLGRVTTAGVWSAEMTSYLEFSYLELLKQTDGGWATR
jgi:hypothetical protein